MIGPNVTEKSSCTPPHRELSNVTKNMSRRCIVEEISLLQTNKQNKTKQVSNLIEGIDN